MLNRTIDAGLLLSIIIIGWFSIAGYNRLNNGINLSGGFLATHMWEVLMYLVFVLILIIADVNRKFTYIIAAPLFVVLIVLLPIGFMLGT